MYLKKKIVLLRYLHSPSIRGEPSVSGKADSSIFGATFKLSATNFEWLKPVGGAQRMQFKHLWHAFAGVANPGN